jgi:hypothetical protein
MNRRIIFLPPLLVIALLIIDYIWISSVFSEVLVDCEDWHGKEGQSLPILFSKGLMCIGLVGSLLSVFGASLMRMRKTDATEEGRALQTLLRVAAFAALVLLVGAFLIEYQFVPMFDDGCGA